MITQARLKKLLDYDPATGVFMWKVSMSNRAPVGSVAGRISSVGYIDIQIDKVRYGAHRLAWLCVTGRWPSEDMDHVNCVRDDNRIENLREASRAENIRNMSMRVDNTSGAKGVSWHTRSGRWRARITVDGVCAHLGYFDRIEDAKATYVEASKRLHKEFGRAA